MKTLIHVVLFFLFASSPSIAQILPLTIEPPGGNKKASVSEQIGIVKIEIKYNRPGVKGREGKIYNTQVAHYGFADLGHGTSDGAPWRAGANEMDRAIYFRIMGEKNFRTLSTKAAVLTKMNRLDEAKKVMEEALPLGNMLDIHFYARQLLSLKQTDEATKVYQLNYKRYPNQFTTNVGLGRAYSSKGDYKKALSYMKGGTSAGTRWWQ